MTCRRLPGKVAIVTASTDGIGFAIARRLAQEGAAVVVSSRKQKNVDLAVNKLKAEGLRVAGVVCHVAKQDDRQKLFETAVREFGGIDILVSNAAANPSSAPPLDMTEQAYDKTWDTNVKASFYVIKEAVPFMEKRGGGSVVVVSSIGGYQPGPGTEVYGATKTALFGLIRALTPQLASMNIRINGLAPGLIKTAFSRYLWENDSILQLALMHNPMGRIGTPDECAGTVAFLVSEDASYVTGETVVVAGGSFSRL